MSYKDEDQLRRIYVEEDKSMAEAAEYFDCSPDTISRWVNKFGIETGRLTKEERRKLSLSNQQRQIVKGVLMGDGCIQRRENQNQNPYFIVTMKNKEFIRWLSRSLGDIVSSLKKRTGEYADTLDNSQWILKTYSSPLFREFANWYSTGKKRWPVEENLTPLELKMLYVTDGSPVKHSQTWACKISAINEADRKEKVAKMFKKSLDIDVTWHSSNKSTKGVIYIPSEYSRVILNQEPVPGFEYKWPNQRV